MWIAKLFLAPISNRFYAFQIGPHLGKDEKPAISSPGFGLVCNKPAQPPVAQPTDTLSGVDLRNHAAADSGQNRRAVL